MWSDTVLSACYIFSVETKTKLETDKKYKNLCSLILDIQTLSR